LAIEPSNACIDRTIDILKERGIGSPSVPQESVAEADWITMGSIDTGVR
jgi:hypothetical protein